MSLVKCKECGKDISKKAKVCSDCGNKNKNEINKMMFIIPIIIVCIIGIFWMMLGGKVINNMKANQENKLYTSTIATIYEEKNKIKKYIDKAYEIYNAGGSAINYWKETKEEADKFFNKSDEIKKNIEELKDDENYDKLKSFYNSYTNLLTMTMAVGNSVRDRYDNAVVNFDKAYKDLKENNN